jgi:hypothetical protein
MAVLSASSKFAGVPMLWCSGVELSLSRADSLLASDDTISEPGCQAVRLRFCAHDGQAFACLVGRSQERGVRMQDDTQTTVTVSSLPSVVASGKPLAAVSPSAVPVAVTVGPIEEYFPQEYRPGCWRILCDYPTGEVLEEDGKLFEVRGIRVHCGRRSGQPVEFSRLSDAERLCRVLNGEEAPSC